MKKYLLITMLACDALCAGASADGATSLSAVTIPKLDTWVMAAAGLCLTGFGRHRRSK